MKKRSIRTCLLTLVLLIAAFTAAPSLATEQVPAIGDMTGDGQTSAADAAVMLRALAFGRISETEADTLDLTKNGEANGMDARAILFYACGGIADWVAFGERVSSGLCDERHFDRFSYAGTQNDGMGNYKSENVSVTITRARANNSNYYLADVYVQDLSCFVTAFSRDDYMARSETVRTIFESIPGAIIGMNGDYYSINDFGPVVRNGVTYQKRVSTYWDIAVLQSDGVLDIFPYGVLKKSALAEMNAYQTWVFGPALLDADGHAKTKFRSKVQPANPRSALAYYEPGHYAFLTVDGRSGESDGMTMKQLSQLCEDLGFTAAYNLDGGQSSVLMGQAGAINDPFRDGRPVSDILVIRELPVG